MSFERESREAGLATGSLQAAGGNVDLAAL